jgi:hypothetical protein
MCSSSPTRCRFCRGGAAAGLRDKVAGKAQIETMTCRVPNSCPIPRATAVTHGYSGSVFSFACKEIA